MFSPYTFLLKISSWQRIDIDRWQCKVPSSFAYTGIESDDVLVPDLSPSVWGEIDRSPSTNPQMSWF